MKKKWIVAIATLALIAAGTFFLLSGGSAGNSAMTKKSYEYAMVSRGKLETVITSSGTLAPVSTVSVLSQMSGIAEKVYADYNDHVKKGQVLVTLNTDMLKLEQKEAQATLSSAQANYNLAALDYQNNVTLAAKGLVAEYDVKSSKTTMDVKSATLTSAKSALQVIETKLTQYAQIKSPIDGIVIERNVDTGQSVIEGSSSNATALFTLAGDLSKMEIKAEVDELDISSIQVAQAVRFTVEANPSKIYTGTVGTIRLDPVTTDKVVYYYVIIKADNADGSLLPGMTANVEFIKETKDSALLVPNAALRYQPSSLTVQEIQRMEYAASITNLSADQQKTALAEYDANIKSANTAIKSTKTTQGTGLSSILSGGGPGMGGPGGPGGKSSSSDSSTESATTSTLAASSAAVVKKPLWYLDTQGKLAVRMVSPGSTNGTNTEIIGADDLEGAQIILREKTE